ncbi:unnamed protein product [Malus baccata var. baccata]
MRLSNILEPRLGARGLTKGLGKIKELKISGCEELTSSLEKEDRCFPHLISLVRLVIEGNSALVEDLGKELEGLLQVPILACKLEYLEINKCERLSKLPKGLHQLSFLQELYISHCSSLVSFPDVGLPPSLKVLEIRECDRLMYIAKYQIPQNLKRIEIWRCGSLKSLVEEEKELVVSCSSSFSVSLEHLEIGYCASLTSLSLRGQLYRALKHLEIEDCEGLELIASYRNCGKLEVSPEDIRNLTSLKELEIDFLEGLTSFPPNLTSLAIYKLKSCKRLWELEWGLDKLTSLKNLWIKSEDPDVLSFPPDGKEEMLLPKSLTKLQIYDFPNLKKISKGIQFLTSLQTLSLKDCPMLASIPDEGLSLSLGQLWIVRCPLLKERCQPGKGRYWPKISHIPCLSI